MNNIVHCSGVILNASFISYMVEGFEHSILFSLGFQIFTLLATHQHSKVKTIFFWFFDVRRLFAGEIHRRRRRFTFSIVYLAADF